MWATQWGTEPLEPGLPVQRAGRRMQSGPSAINFMARLGHVKALASLDPLCGLTALTRLSVEPFACTYVMARKHCWHAGATMVRLAAAFSAGED